MKKQIKTLIMAGLITGISSSSVVTSHAAAKVKNCKTKVQYICIDSKGHIYQNVINCGNNNNNDNNENNKPENPGDINDDNIVSPEIKPTTPPDITPETKPEVDSSFSAYQKEVLDLVNKERAKVGAKSLKLNIELSNVATMKSQDMIDKNYFDHNSPTYGSPFDMMKKFNISYKTAGENIAMGQKTPHEVMKSWMNSDGHRKNILNPEYTELGVGISKNAQGQIYWTQMFIGR